MARRFGGAELEAMVAELSAAHSVEMAAAHRQMLEHLATLEAQSHGRDLELIADLLARQDAVLAGYDRRVAALTLRVLDLEERTRQRGPDSVDATALIDDHHPRGS